MYCPKCNTCYMDDGKFCQDCGSPLIQNAVYSEKKPFPTKIILAVAALSLSLIAGFSLYKKDGPTSAVKAPDAPITGSALRFTAGNSIKGEATKHRARHLERNTFPESETAAPGTFSAPASAVAGSAPAVSAVPRVKSSGDKASPDVGTPRPANTVAQAAGSGKPAPTASRSNSANKVAASQQPQMVVIRDPLSAEKRN